MSFPPEDVAATLRLLRILVDDRAQLAGISEPERRELLILAGQVSRVDGRQKARLRKALVRQERAQDKAHDSGVLAKTGIRQKRNRTAVAQLPQPAHERPAEDPAAFREVRKPRNCYVCKADFTRVHFFYDSM